MVRMLADNLRYAAEDSDGLRYFTWDRNGMNLLMERDIYGTVVAQYSHGFASVEGSESLQAARKIVDGVAYYQYPHYDLTGNVMRVTDSGGAVTHSYERNAWGEELSATEGDVANRFGYNANWIRLKDGPYDLSPTRVYDPKLGRFLSRDGMGNRQGGYLYCQNQPVSCADPGGQDEPGESKEEKKGDPRPRPTRKQIDDEAKSRAIARGVREVEESGLKPGTVAWRRRCREVLGNPEKTVELLPGTPVYKYFLEERERLIRQSIPQHLILTKDEKAIVWACLQRKWDMLRSEGDWHHEVIQWNMRDRWLNLDRIGFVDEDDYQRCLARMKMAGKQRGSRARITAAIEHMESLLKGVIYFVEGSIQAQRLEQQYRDRYMPKKPFRPKNPRLEFKLDFAMQGTIPTPFLVGIGGEEYILRVRDKITGEEWEYGSVGIALSVGFPASWSPPSDWREFETAPNVGPGAFAGRVNCYSKGAVAASELRIEWMSGDARGALAKIQGPSLQGGVSIGVGLMKKKRAPKEVPDDYVLINKDPEIYVDPWLLEE